MASLVSRPNTYVADTLIVSADVNANEDELFDMLGAVSTDKFARIKASDASSPPLELDQTGAGLIFKLSQAGVSKIEVLNDGQLESKLATGTAPFKVASSTKVTNLNADLLDGKEASEFFSSGNTLVLDAGAGTGAAVAYLEITHDTKDDVRVRYNETADALEIFNQTDSIVLLQLGLQDNDPALFDGQVRTNQSAPAASNDLTRKDYVDNKKVPFAVSVFFLGELSTSDTAPAFITPGGVNNVQIRKLKAYAQGGSGSDSVISVKKNGSSIGSLTVNANGAVITNDIADVALVEDDIVTFEITTAGGYLDVSVQIEGDMELMA